MIESHKCNICKKIIHKNRRNITYHYLDRGYMPVICKPCAVKQPRQRVKALKVLYV